jgi:hypothetical protein
MRAVGVCREQLAHAGLGHVTARRTGIFDSVLAATTIEIQDLSSDICRFFDSEDNCNAGHIFGHTGMVAATDSHTRSIVDPMLSAETLVIAVSMNPGTTAFAAMPNGPSSIAMS